MDIERRSLLKGLATGLAGSVVAPETAESQTVGARPPTGSNQPPSTAAGPTPAGLLDDHQRRTLSSLAETILPGSVAAGAVDLIDRVATVDGTATQRRLMNAIGRFDHEARTVSGGRWLDLDEAVRIELMQRASTGAAGEPDRPAWTKGQPVVAPATPPGPPTWRDDFEFLKTIVGNAYAATETGMRALGWTGRSAWRELPGCTTRTRNTAMPPGDVPRWTRRQFLALSAGGAVTSVRAGFGAGRSQASARPWGVQLYTVREQISSDAAATLRRVAALGYTEVEVLQPTLSVVAPLAKDLGLQVVSVHLDAATARGEGFDAFLAQAKRHGLRYVVFPFVPPGERPADRGGFEALAQRLARMSRAASALELRFCYHNHAFEFGRDRDGTQWLDVLMQGTAAAGMGLELDVFWAAIAGDDPVALLRRYAGRVALVHLKDKDPRAATSLVESQVPRTAFVEVGSGALDFTAILAAARAAGVAHYFVEQDQTPGDPFDSLKKSRDYLSGLAGK